MVLISTTGKADVLAALERPGVIAAFTGRDLAPDYGSLPTAWIVSEDLIVPDHPPIAAGEARYLGDAVAVVVAEDPYQAADAVEAVQVEYEPLPAVVDPVAALADGAPLVHGGQATNRAFTWTFSGGDYAAARRRATVVVSRRFVQQRVMPTAMEPRAVLAEPFPATGEFTLWTSTQVPHFVRLLMSSVCGIGEQKLRVIAPDVGGGFVLKGSGRETRGTGTASATVEVSMTEQDADTRVRVVTSLEVTGKQAQFGRGVMADIAAKLTDQFAACLAERVRGPAPASDGATAAPAPTATQAPAVEGAAGPQAAAAGESLDLVSTVAMPVLKRFGPVLGGVAFGLILGLLLGHRRRIVIMTAAAPPGGYPPAPTVL